MMVGRQRRAGAGRTVFRPRHPCIRAAGWPATNSIWLSASILGRPTDTEQLYTVSDAAGRGCEQCFLARQNQSSTHRDTRLAAPVLNMAVAIGLRCKESRGSKFRLSDAALLLFTAFLKCLWNCVLRHEQGGVVAVGEALRGRLTPYDNAADGRGSHTLHGATAPT